jgi:hypothetical protein
VVGVTIACETGTDGVSFTEGTLARPKPWGVIWLREVTSGAGPPNMHLGQAARGQ